MPGGHMYYNKDSTKHVVADLTDEQILNQVEDQKKQALEKQMFDNMS